MSAVIYLRSATGNRAQTTWQEVDCREYLHERDRTETGVITDTGHPGPGLAKLLDAAANGEVTDVVVSDLSRRGRTPWPTCAPSTRSTRPESPSTSQAAPSAARSLMTASET